MGLSGSGKSYLSQILHQDFGFEWIRSDVIRKELAGLEPTQSAKAEYQKGIYTPEMTQKVYEEMIKRAKKLSSEGKNVVLDATFLREEHRQMVRSTFPDAVFLLAVASEEEIKRRLLQRSDVSDADFEVYLKQKEGFIPPSYAIPIDTQADRESIKESLRRVLGL